MRHRRVGKLGWIAIVLALLGGTLFLGWRYAIANHGAAMLNGFDQLVGGNSGAKLALENGRYGPHPAQRVDVLVPDRPNSEHRPVVVFLFGGGWQSGSPPEFQFVGRTLTRAGYVVVIPGYRLGPEGAYPHMLEDTAKAVAWTRDHVAQYGGNPDLVFLMGQSAGAYNVVMMGLERQWLGREGLPEGFVKGVVGLSGPYDFYPFTSDSARKAFGHVADPAITQPINFVRREAPPMLLLTGDKDTVVRPRNSQRLAQALTMHGGTAELVIVPGADHLDTMIKLAAPFSRDRRVLDPVLAFLARHGGTSGDIQAGSR